MDRFLKAYSQRSIEVRATSLVVISAILYGFLGYFGASLINSKFSISSMLFWRFSIASIWMSIYLICKNKLVLKSFPTRIPITLILISSACYCIACTFYFMASGLIGTGISMVIYFAYPIFVVTMMMVKGRTWIDKNTFISLLITFFGLVLLKGNSTHHVITISGFVYGLAAALFFAFYVFISKTISNKMPSSLNTLILCLCNALFFLIYSLCQHSYDVPTTLMMWVFAIGLGVIATALPIQLMLEGLKSISASKASIVSALEPAITLFVGMLFLNEVVDNRQMIGVLLILISACYIQKD